MLIGLFASKIRADLTSSDGDGKKSFFSNEVRK